MRTKSPPEQQEQAIIDAESLWFSGHFPDNPVLPGVAQLKMVIDLLSRREFGKVRIAGLSRVKFRRLVRPGEVLDITVSTGDDRNRHNFNITCGNEVVCSGKVLITPTEHVTTT